MGVARDLKEFGETLHLTGDKDCMKCPPPKTHVGGCQNHGPCLGP